ncbi:MAG: glycoside hydrolase family 15 protein [Candidatus Nanohaloarchaea archaeon]
MIRTGWEYDPDKNGLYPAALETDNSDMDKYWIRDNYFIYKAVGDSSIPEAFKEIVDRYGEKLREATRKSVEDRIESPSGHLHPRFNENLEEIDGEWADFQIDSYANLLEVLSEEGHEEEARKVYRYLRGIRPLETECFGPWEQEHGMHPYTLTTVVEAYRSFSENVENVPDEDLELYEQKIRRMLPEKNLSSLMILYLDPDFIDSELEKEVMEATEDLTGEHGVARWKGDDWSGNDWTADTEPQWNMGHLLRYLATGEEEYFERQQEIKQEYGTIPESMVRYGDGVYRPNVNNPLLWAEALYREAERKYRMEKTVSAERFRENGDGYTLSMGSYTGIDHLEPLEAGDPGLIEFPESFEAGKPSPEAQLDVALDNARETSLESIDIET